MPYENTNGNSHGAQRRGERLIIVSNRGPIEHKRDETGSLKRSSSGGGLANALGCAFDGVPVTWIAGAVSDDDRAHAAIDRRLDLANGSALQLVSPPADAYRLSYGTFSNAILWFLQHGLWHRLRRPNIHDEALDAWQRGYLPVNQAFGEAVAWELRASGARRVMLHDYHLYAAPLLIRRLQPQAVLQHFIHIPWPGPEAWSNLPRHIVAAICEGLLANDSVVFQTTASAQNFLATCAAYLPDVTIDDAAGRALRRGRRTRVWANPISVHPGDLEATLSTPAAQSYRERLAAPDGMRTIVRVDRLDPAKNIVAGFRAYDRLLQQHPEWLGHVRFLAFLVPSRTIVPEYRSYVYEVFSAVDAINRRYGKAGWRPIQVFHEQNRLQALAALTMYDALLVNSIADGMNLVAKEGALVNERDGALVLSTSAGAFDELRDGALPVQPLDVEQTAQALHAALTLPAGERRERAERLRQAVLRHDLDDWLRLLLADLAATEASREWETVAAAAP
jgi:trehalose 6-phosphate synthase